MSQDQTDTTKHPHAEAFDLPGGPAFPISIPGCGDNGCAGMSLRDWFAAQAIQRMISLCEDRDGGWDPVAVASGCYAIADAMLDYRKLP